MLGVKRFVFVLKCITLEDCFVVFVLNGSKGILALFEPFGEVLVLVDAKL